MDDEKLLTPKAKKSVAVYSTKKSSLPNLPSLNKPSFMSGDWQKKLRSKVAALVMICALAGFGGGWLGAKVYNHSAITNASTAQKQSYVSSEGQLITQIAKDIGQSVVSIDVQSQTAVQTFFGIIPQSQQSAGTGFIVSDSGVIVTNRHVVPAGATKVSITLADGTIYNDVQIIGRTSETNSLDVAFLKIMDLKGKKLAPVKLGDSSKMVVGDRVIAIGNALGQFQNTVTSGILSGYGRNVTAGDQTGTATETLTNLFQTDAAINPGNSGGPLVNINGEVIGINTAIAGGAQNIGFSIPINDAKGLIDSVLSTGKLLQPYLGVRYVSITDDIAYQLNLPVNRGAYIAPATAGQDSIIPGSPAEKAGLREKDIITKVNDINVDAKTSLTGALSSFKVGDNVTLTVTRDGKTITVKATLEAVPAQ